MLNSCSHLWDPGLCVYLCLGCWNLPLTLKAADNGTGKQARGLTSFICKENKELKAQRVQKIIPRLKPSFSFWPVVNYLSRFAWVALMQTLISDCWQAQESSLSTIAKVECFIFRDHLHQAAFEPRTCLNHVQLILSLRQFLYLDFCWISLLNFCIHSHLTDLCCSVAS